MPEDLSPSASPASSPWGETVPSVFLGLASVPPPPARRSRRWPQSTRGIPSAGAAPAPAPRAIFRYLVGTGLITTPADPRLGRRLQGRDTLIGSRPRTARHHAPSPHR